MTQKRENHLFIIATWIIAGIVLGFLVIQVRGCEEASQYSVGYSNGYIRGLDDARSEPHG